MHITVVHNPEAGAGRPTRAELLAALRAADYECRYQTTHGDRLVVQDPGDAVLVVGGDGTLRQTVLALRGRDVPIVLLPAGTANNTACTLGIDVGLDSAIRRLTAGRPRAIDVGTSHGTWGDRPFIEGSGFGVVPELIDIVEGYAQDFGHDVADVLRRDLALLESIVALTPPFDCVIDADGKTHTARLLALEVMNIRFIGPRLPVAPDADPTDGMLDVAWVEEGERDLLRASIRDWRDGDDQGEQRRTTPFNRLRAAEVHVRCASPLAHVDDWLWPPPPLRRGRHQPLELQFGVSAGTQCLLI